MANPFLIAPLRRYLARLRYPQLFVLFAVLFLVDLVIPDVVPFIDEILLLVTTMLIGSFKQRRRQPVDIDG